MQFSFSLPAVLSLSLLFSPILSFPLLSTRAPADAQNKRIIYYQDASLSTNQSSMLPLINGTSKPLVSTVILSTFIVYENGFAIYTKDHDGKLSYIPLNNSRFDGLWSDVKKLQARGIKVSPMLLGNWPALERNQSYFEANYNYLRDGLKQYNFDGIDLDIEDVLNAGGAPPINLNQTIRVIDQLRKDFGPDFQITMAPVASCLSLDCGSSCISGFDYKDLEEQRGDDIAWYNTQFYNGYGSAADPKCYEAIVKDGWKPEKVVMGLSTNSANGPGYVDIKKLKGVIESLVKEFPTFGGVDGWEYFDALPGGWVKPWTWSEIMADYMGLNNNTSY